MANPVAILNRGQFLSVPNMRVPSQGSQAASFALDHTVQAALDGDLREIIENGELDFIQSVFIDNSLNAATFTLTFPDCAPNGFKIAVGPNQQGIYPITLPVGGTRFTSQTAGAISVPIIFYNIPLPYFQWGPITATATFATPQGAFTERSGVVAAGGVSQQLAAINAARKRIIIQNPLTAASQGIGVAESLFINFTAAAGANDGSSIELGAGGIFDSASGPVSTERINVTATSINHKFIAKEM